MHYMSLVPSATAFAAKPTTAVGMILQWMGVGGWNANKCGNCGHSVEKIFIDSKYRKSFIVRDALNVVGTLNYFLCCIPTTAVGMIWQWMGVSKSYANNGGRLCR